LFGQSNNVLQILNAIDIYVQSSSFGEGFPNVVAEAMSCGIPCVVTDVGDASNIVGKTGQVVPPNSPEKLAKKIEQTINNINKRKYNNPRLRIRQHFTINKMINKYNKLWYNVYKI
jgi:glycosyltransferase involved in cell wall biosynthesis